MSSTMLATAAEKTFEIEPSSEFVTMTVCGQLFGIPVLEVQDILGPQRITYVPLAPAEIVGSLNLRGHIVTAMDLRLRFGLEARQEGATSMSVVVQQGGELYSMIVDHVGEVMSLPASAYEKNPATLSPIWREVSKGIYRLNDRLLIALDVAKLLRLDEKRNG